VICNVEEGMTHLQVLIGLAMGTAALLDTSALAGQEPAPSKKPQPSSSDTVAVSSAEYDGWKVYHTHCDRCHGQDATGSTFAPNLRQSVGANGMTEAAFSSVVRDGLAAKGMPAFQPTITDAQIGQLYAYVKARSTGTLGPGRPKRST
jgi:mono/diheme cytochrome c family protein